MRASNLITARARRALVGGAVALFTFTAGQMSIAPAEAATVRNPEDLMIVDCLLPGQVRKLGRMSTFLTARRPIRTTQADCEIRGGEYVAFDRANYQTALRIWTEQAQLGDAAAQNYVGEIYHKGLGTVPDYAKAAEWYQKSAAQGFKRAMVNLGYLYEQGLGVERDITRALNLCRQSSGLPAENDDLVFASTVTVSAEAQAEISQLRETVEQQREESEALRAEVQTLRRELDQRRRALDEAAREQQDLRSKLQEKQSSLGIDSGQMSQLQQELAARQGEIEREREQLDSERQALRNREQSVERQLGALRERERVLVAGADSSDAELSDIRRQASELGSSLGEVQARAVALQAELDANAERLAKERAAYEAELEALREQVAARQEDWELMRILEGQLASKEGEVRRQRRQIQDLERRVARGQPLPQVPAMASVVQTTAVGPVVEIIEPPLTVTRGRPAAMLRRTAGNMEVLGKVSADSGIESVKVNDRVVGIAGNGVFRSTVEVESGGSLVTVSAVDSEGLRTALEFMLIPQTESRRTTSTTAAATTSRQVRVLPRGVNLGRYYALVIGNNDYQDYQNLQSASNDARAVAEVLRQRYGYQTELVLNANRFEILSALNDMREKLKSNDNLLIYYAGHGEIDPVGKQGYWLPVDARSNMPMTWISNSMVSDILNTMEARHVLVVADSCYSGAMTRSSMATFDGANAESAWTDWVKAMVNGRSRTALTSGGVQPVPDTGRGEHSFFARAFLNVLEDNNELLDSQRLFREISVSLALAAVDAPIAQTPEYAPIQFAGHESGQFFFNPSTRATSRRTAAVSGL
jgi:predicted  nucleic acid-binding Zn-ribbon protein